MPDPHILPDDKHALRELVIALQAERQSLRSENRRVEKALRTEKAKATALDQYIAKLEQQLATLRRARYGRRSEQLDQHVYQLELMLEDLGASVAEQTVVVDESQVPECNKASKPVKRRRAAQSHEDMRARDYWPMWRSPSIWITCRCTANRLSIPERVWS